MTPHSYIVEFEDRYTDQLIFSFTGVGMNDGAVQKKAFAKSLDAVRPRRSICYITDRQRSWFNHETAAITDLILEKAAKYKSVITLGSSMGGFGAIYFAGLIPNCKLSIAFGPQFSMRAGVMKEGDRRWRNFTSKIAQWNIDHCLISARNDIQYLVFLQPVDDHHKVEFDAIKPDRMSIIGVNDGTDEHDVAWILRQHRLLAPILNYAINGDPIDIAEIEAACARVDGPADRGGRAGPDLPHRGG
jgi:hypothetical protein